MVFAFQEKGLGCGSCLPGSCPPLDRDRKRWLRQVAAAANKMANTTSGTVQDLNILEHESANVNVRDPYQEGGRELHRMRNAQVKWPALDDANQTVELLSWSTRGALHRATGEDSRSLRGSISKDLVDADAMLVRHMQGIRSLTDPSYGA